MINLSYFGSKWIAPFRCSFSLRSCYPIPAFRYWAADATMDGTILQKRCREFTRCTHATELRDAARDFKTGFSWRKKNDEIPFVFFHIISRVVLFRGFSDFRFCSNRIIRFRTKNLFLSCTCFFLYLETEF